MSYAAQVAAGVRTPQELLVVKVPQCANHYASGTVINEILESVRFDQAAWTKSGGCTVTPETVVDPLGATTGDTIALAGVGDYIESSSTATDAQSNAFNASVWVKAAAAGTITLRITNTIAVVETISEQKAVTTGWNRISVSGTFTAAANGKARMRIYRDTGDLASVYAWGAQLTPGLNLYAYGQNTIVAAQTVSKCAAADAGNGSRCYYTFSTCQDIANYATSFSYPDDGLKSFTFCREDAPLALAGADVMPLLESASFAAQKIDAEKAVTQSERVHFKLSDHAATWNWNQDKANQGALTNTTTPSGTFWRRFLRLHRNYANPLASATLKTGFVESGAVESDYQTRGKYLVKNLSLSSGGMLDMECTDRLKLLKMKAPAKISETNLINGAINSAVTSLVVDDASEVTEPGTGYNVCLELTYDGTNEFVNVTARDTATNTLTIQRGRWGTAATSHANNAVFREVLQYGTENPTPASAPLGKNPIDIAVELLYRAGLAASEIDTTTLNDERDTWLAGSVSGTTETGILFKRAGENVGYGNGAISEQAEIESYLKQIREVCMLDLWVNESQQVTGRLFAPARPTVTLADLTETNDILADSVHVDDNEASRFSRVIIGYDLQSGEAGDKLSDYGRVMVRVDADAEADGSYGEARTKTVLCPWLKTSDSSTASKLAGHLLNRLVDPQREVSLALELRHDGIECGDFATVTTGRVVLPSGATDAQRIMQMVKKARDDRRGRLEFLAVDTALSTKRYAFIAPVSHPDYDSADADERRYGYIGDATTNQVGTAGDPGYLIW